MLDLSHSCSSLISGWNWLSMIALKGNVDCAIAQLDATCALNQIQHVHVKYYRPVLNRPTLGRLSSSKLSVQLSVHLSGRNNEVYSRRNGRGRELISAKSVQTHWFKRWLSCGGETFTFLTRDFFFSFSRLIDVVRNCISKYNAITNQFPIIIPSYSNSNLFLATCTIFFSRM